MKEQIAKAVEAGTCLGKRGENPWKIHGNSMEPDDFRPFNHRDFPWKIHGRRLFNWWKSCKIHGKDCEVGENEAKSLREMGKNGDFTNNNGDFTNKNDGMMRI